MKPTEILKREHEVILMVVGAAEREAESIGATGKVDVERVGKMVDFIRTFADRCHHGKEENVLFAKMAAKGFPSEAGPIAVMLHEHGLGRSFVRAVDEALEGAGRGDETARARVIEGLRDYARLLRAHIHKEDSILFPMCDQALSAQDQDDLAVAFERIERDEIGAGVHEKYHRLAHELAGR